MLIKKPAGLFSPEAIRPILTHWQSSITPQAWQALVSELTACADSPAKAVACKHLAVIDWLHQLMPLLPPEAQEKAMTWGFSICLDHAQKPQSMGWVQYFLEHWWPVTSPAFRQVQEEHLLTLIKAEDDELLSQLASDSLTGLLPCCTPSCQAGFIDHLCSTPELLFNIGLSTLQEVLHQLATRGYAAQVFHWSAQLPSEYQQAAPPAYAMLPMAWSRR